MRAKCPEWQMRLRECDNCRAGQPGSTQDGFCSPLFMSKPAILSSGHYPGACSPASARHHRATAAFWDHAKGRHHTPTYLCPAVLYKQERNDGGGPDVLSV
jgi:hypothetical protein